VSVYAGSGGIVLDPSRLRAGPVEFNITNQSGKAVSLAVVTGAGRTLDHSASIPSGGTAQLKTILSLHSVGVGYAGRPASVKRLTVSGRAPTGDDEHTQP
jgi:hypothetical protein